jgi:hypothetical protein
MSMHYGTLLSSESKAVKDVHNFEHGTTDLVSILRPANQHIRNLSRCDRKDAKYGNVALRNAEQGNTVARLDSDRNIQSARNAVQTLLVTGSFYGFSKTSH